MGGLLRRRILLIAPRFFGYDNDIANELKNCGAHVDFIPDRPFETPFMKAITRFKREWMIRAADRLYRRLLEGFGCGHYDYVLVINGQTLSSTILSELRVAYPQAKFILYMWDSMENRKSVQDNLGYFDECFSFDPRTASIWNMKFRPLFFSEGFERPAAVTPTYDISFVGTAHTDRYSVVSSLDRQLQKNITRFWYLYLQAPWVFYVYRATNETFRGAKINEFKFAPLSKSDVQKVFFQSRAILDIEHPKQTGLTMRTFETLGASKKLVTTNAQVRDYDFYNPANIHIIDRANAEVPEEFLSTPYEPIAPELYAKYRLAGWVDEILDLHPAIPSGLREGVLGSELLPDFGPRG